MGLLRLQAPFQRHWTIWAIGLLVASWPFLELNIALSEAFVHESSLKGKLDYLQLFSMILSVAVHKGLTRFRLSRHIWNHVQGRP